MRATILMVSAAAFEQREPSAAAGGRRGTALTTPFVDLTPAPGMPNGYKYAFMVPVLLPTPGGALLAFSEAHMLIYKAGSSQDHQQRSRSWERDGDDGCRDDRREGGG